MVTLTAAISLPQVALPRICSSRLLRRALWLWSSELPIITVIIYIVYGMSDISFHKNIRLPADEYIGTKAYFITICAAARRPVFVDHGLCSQILSLLRQQTNHFCFEIHAYCLMPDHLHFLAQGTRGDSDLLRLVKAFRIGSSRSYLSKTGSVLWQKKYYDHILRSESSLNQVAWYIWMNPVRKGLAKIVGEYRFAGSFTDAEPFRVRPKKEWSPGWKKSN